MWGKIITEFVALRPKAYSYLDNYGNDHKKAKGTKKCVIKQQLMFQNFKDCLFNNKNLYRSQQRFKSYNQDDNSEVKKSKGTKKCVIKRELIFENYKDCLMIKLY